MTHPLATWSAGRPAIWTPRASVSAGRSRPGPDLAASITRAASAQTYYTVRFLVDRDRVADAYRAYAYFRWLDDRLDEDGLARQERRRFVARQQALVAAAYNGRPPADVEPEERLLVELVGTDDQADSGLRRYIDNLMAVMAFDAERRGRRATAAELDAYTRSLAIAVTEALHLFIGGVAGTPAGPIRYRAASGAHLVHMLRDTFEDVAAGYYNVPAEYLDAHRLEPADTDHPAHCAWVQCRVSSAAADFRAGREYLAQVRCLRCRLAGFSYIARFEWLLDVIRHDQYHLRRTYPRPPVLAAALGLAVDVATPTRLVHK